MLQVYPAEICAYTMQISPMLLNQVHWIHSYVDQLALLHLYIRVI